MYRGRGIRSDIAPQMKSETWCRNLWRPRFRQFERPHARVGIGDGRVFIVREHAYNIRTGEGT